MNLLDILLISFWALAWVGAYISGSDALYKLFLGLIVGFLMYQVVAFQAEILRYIPDTRYDSYQRFLHTHDTPILSFFLILIPVLGIVFMLNKRLIFITRERSISQILLGFLLPIFLIWILAHLARGSILSQSELWQNVFYVLEQSGIYKIFTTLPWGIFLLLLFLVFYKSIFLIIGTFILWIYREVILQFFKSWNNEKMLKKSSEDISEDFEE